MSVRSILVEEFETEMKELKKMEVGSDQYKIAVEGITKIVDRINEIDNKANELTLRDTIQMNEHISREHQIKAEKRSRDITVWTTVGIASAQLIAAGLAFVASVNFEREGTFTTEGGRSALRQLLKFVK
jgi:hypothetical protein